MAITNSAKVITIGELLDTNKKLSLLVDQQKKMLEICNEEIKRLNTELVNRESTVHTLFQGTEHIEARWPSPLGK